jgi:tetratricopeptide (TPR) repeat protein
MATKAKPKAKAQKKTASRPARSTKSLKLKAKPQKPKRPAQAPARASAAARKVSKAEKTPPAAAPQKVRPKHFSNAVEAYEAGLKLLHSEQFEKAVKCFEDLIAEHGDEPEIQDRAKILIHVARKKLNEKSPVLRSAEDHYNVGVAELNRRELNTAVQHLQQALKLAPRGDHILYALAAASALQGNRDQALSFLRQSLDYRPENRFMAVRDSDFETLQEDSDFKQLVTPQEK